MAAESETKAPQVNTSECPTNGSATPPRMKKALPSMMRNRPTARPCPSAPLRASHIGRALSPPSETEARQTDSHNRQLHALCSIDCISASNRGRFEDALVHVLFLLGFRILCPYRNACLSDPWDKVSALALVGISCALFRMLR